MAATAFLAASSRSSAAVMGRPLSLRIRLASWTLVPGKQRRALLQQTTLFKTTLCERRRVPSEESIRTDDRWLELWVNAGKFNCSSESSHDRERQRGKRAICVIPLSWRGHGKQVPGDMPAPMGGPATKRGGRKRDALRNTAQPTRLCQRTGCLPAPHAERLSTDLTSLSQHRAGGAAVVKRERESEESKRATEIKVKCNRFAPSLLKPQTPAVYAAFSDFTHGWLKRKDHLQNLSDPLWVVLLPDKTSFNPPFNTHHSELVFK